MEAGSPVREGSGDGTQVRMGEDGYSKQQEGSGEKRRPFEGESGECWEERGPNAQDLQGMSSGRTDRWVGARVGGWTDG